MLKSLTSTLKSVTQTSKSMTLHRITRAKTLGNCPDFVIKLCETSTLASTAGRPGCHSMTIMCTLKSSKIFGSRSKSINLHTLKSREFQVTTASAHIMVSLECTYYGRIITDYKYGDINLKRHYIEYLVSLVLLVINITKNQILSG